MTDRRSSPNPRTGTRTWLFLSSLVLVGAWPPGGPSSDPPLLELHWDADTTSIRESCQEAVQRAKRRLGAALAGAGSASERLVAAENALADLQDAMADPTVTAIAEVPEEAREEARSCRELIRNASIALSTGPELLSVAREALATSESPLVGRLAERYLRLGRERGEGLEPEPRTRLRQALARLRSLEASYRQAMTSDAPSIRISDDEAAGLSPSFLSAFERSDSGYRVPVDFSAASRRFLQEMPSSRVRRRYWLAFMRRGGDANVRRLTEALALRREIAEILGYPSWAAYRMEGRLAESPSAVRGRLNGIARELLPEARAQLEALARLKRESGEPGPFSAWDYDYYRSRASDSGADADAVRPYFPLSYSIPATLKIFESVLGIVFERRDDTRSWAKGVQHYLVRDASDGRLLAELYLDLVPRRSKGTRPSEGELRAGRTLPDGGRRHPVVTIVGNGPVGSEDEPASFGHADLVEFFHEMGHAVHMALSQAPYASLGSGSVPWDFVETPSQMFENWAWNPQVLRRVSRNPRTGQPLPDSLIDGLIAQKRSNTALFWTRQVAMALWDLEVHGPEPPDDPNRAWFDVWAETTPVPTARETLPTASFLPAMGGYDAGYYGYVWSRLYAQDLFTAFQGSPGALFGPKVGTRFRRQVLEPGATASPNVLVRRFLGREVRPDAFYRELGISASASERDHGKPAGSDVTVPSG